MPWDNNSRLARSNTSSGNNSYLCRFVAVVLLLALQQSSTSVNALLLLPQPGYFLTSTLLKGRKTVSTYRRNKTIRIHQQIIDSDTEDSTSIIQTAYSSSSSIGSATTYVKSPGTTAVRKPTSDKDMLISRAAKLRQSIVKQQDELITLEQQIACCSIEGNKFNSITAIAPPLPAWSSAVLTNLGTRLVRTFRASSNVFLRKIDRVQKKIGPNNQQWEGRVGDYLFHELFAGIRIASQLAREPYQIKKLVTDPRTRTLVPHAPAILARLDRLEVHVRPIIAAVLNDRQHLASIEPYLDEILERFDDIEPHLPWILENIDTLAPYTGLLLKHVDALLLYANADNLVVEDDGNKNGKESSKYSLANQLLPYLEYYVSKLDTIGPHLVLLRPHVPLLLKHNHIAKVSPHIEKLFARGYETQLAASANIDVLLFWFGWTLRVPFVPALFFALPWSPVLVSFLANRLPKKFVRSGGGYCRNLECSIDDEYGGAWNKLDKI